MNYTRREMARAGAGLAVGAMPRMVVVAASPGFPVPAEKCDVVAEMGDVVRRGSVLG